MQLSDSIVIIPTYNERENIENIIRAVFGLDKVFHIPVSYTHLISVLTLFLYNYLANIPLTKTIIQQLMTACFSYSFFLDFK